MWGVALLTILAVEAAGLVFKYYTDHSSRWKRITWKEFAVGSVIACLVLVPITAFIGAQISIHRKIKFDENLNGKEVTYGWERIQCTRDGSCKWTYKCDPYMVMVSYSCGCGKNGCRTCFRTETRYHSCPYCDEEWTFTVHTTLGDYVIASHHLPDNPDQRRWRKSNPVPSSVQAQAGVGVPRLWLEAKARIESGRPGPVTRRNTYANYFLASERTILQEYSTDIERFEAAGLLPPIATDYYDYYYLDRAYFVGFQPPNERQWQKHVAYFNAHLGLQREGDLHLVLVNHPMADQNPDAFVTAIKVYWQDVDKWRKNAFAKNGILVVVGTDGNIVKWVRGQTGMPTGNEQMIQALAAIKGVPLTPEHLLGRAGAAYMPDSIPIGAIEQVVLVDPVTRFQRVEMEDPRAGFLYLRNEIQPGPVAKALVFGISFVLAFVMWVALYHHESEEERAAHWAPRWAYSTFNPRRTKQWSTR